MPSFDHLFAESKDGLINYNGKNLIRADKFPVKNGDTLIASIEKANSDCLQGFVINITGYCEMDGEIFKKGKGVRMIFWQDTMPKEVKLKIFTKQDFVRVYNIWEETSSYSVCLRDPYNNTVINKEFFLMRLCIAYINLCLQ